MASRSRLVQRSARDVPASYQRPQGSQGRAPLPPYQAPSCPLTRQAQHQLTTMFTDADYAKYKKHLGSCVTTLVNATADSNEALKDAKIDLEQRRERRINKAAAAAAVAGDDDGEPGEGQKSQEEIRQEQHVAELTEKVDRLTRDAERAMRSLLDWTDELKNQDRLVEGVVERVGQQVLPRQRRERDEDNDEDMPDADEAEMLSPTEILKQAREDYERAYNNRTMANRYARSKDYADFKQLVHEAAGEAEALLPASEWFGPDGEPRIRNGATNGAEAEEDEELAITGGVISTKCPLTLQTFKEPLANHKCNHVFEKFAIMEMLGNATIFYENGRRQGRGSGVKKLKCPTTGCEQMLEEKDFYEDEIMKRQVRRQAAQEAREAERAQEGGEESEEDVHGRSQKNGRRETIDVEQMRIKKERMANMEPQSDHE